MPVAHWVHEIHAQGVAMSGAVAVLIGVALCFAGVASLHLTILACGFALSWLLADALGAGVLVGLVIGLGGAVAAWILVSLVFRTSVFVVGALAGGVIGARLYTILVGDDRQVVVAAVFVLVVAVLAGWLANRWRSTVLLWVTALGGAGLILTGLGRWSDSLTVLRYPSPGAQEVLVLLLWLGLAGLGWWVQRTTTSRRTVRTR